MKNITNVAFPRIFVFGFLMLFVSPSFGQSQNEDFKKLAWGKSQNEIYKSIPDSALCEYLISIPKELIVCKWNLKELDRTETNTSGNLLPIILPIYKESKQEFIYNEKSLVNLHSVENDVSKQNENKNVLTVFPNPVNTSFTITLNENISSDEKITVELFNLNGQCNYSGIVNIGVSFDVSGFPIGIYVVKATTSERNTYYSKVLVK